MTATTKDLIKQTALTLFDENGVSGTSVAQIRAQAGVSNGSFFHAYKNRDALCADLFLTSLCSYHTALLHRLPDTAGEGITALLTAHLDWVATSGAQGRFLFEHARSEWLGNIREAQEVENTKLAQHIETWRAPLIAAGQLHPMPSPMFFAQLIGPAQIYCRAWLSGRSTEDPRTAGPDLITCAQRVLLITATD